MGFLEGLGEIPLTHTTQHQSQHDGSAVQMHILDHDAQNTGNDHDADTHDVAFGEGADGGQQKDNGP